MSFMSRLKFKDCTYMLEKSESAEPSRRKKNVKLYIEDVKRYQDIYKTEQPQGEASMYPLLRILLSTDERERAYNIQEKTLRKLLINSIKCSGEDAKRIEECNENELANTVYDVVKSRKSEPSQLSIQDIDNVLNKLSENQSREVQQRQLEYLYVNGSANDIKWVVKIILKKLKFLGYTNILECYNPLAGKLFQKFNTLSKVCEIIESGQAELYAKDVVHPFIPIRPMLSLKFSKDINNIIEKQDFYQEIKLDGERFQLHMEKGEYKYYSRNGHDFSDNFNVLVTPLIKFRGVVHSVILDGEMVMWNKSKERFVTKGETELDIKKIKDPNHHLRPCFCAFDILFLNGVSYLNEPYETRCRILASLFEDQKGIIIKTNPIKIRDVEHLVSIFNAAMEKEEEGIILKRADSTYQPGEREKGGWYKMKADYYDGQLVKDFDCVITGGRFNNPHKRDYIKTFQVGAVERINESKNFNVYVIGEVGLGLSVANRMTLNNNLKPYFRNYLGEKEVDFEMGRLFFGNERPDVFLPPHKSKVLQIRVSELAPSKDFYTNYTFRFPRICEIRYDKIWEDSMTLREFRDAHKGDDQDKRVKKVNQRNFQKDDIVSPTSKRRKILSSRSAAIAAFCQVSVEDVKPIDNSLEGKEFCVMTFSSDPPTANDLKVLIRKHGGEITEFPRGSKTFVVVTDNLDKLKIRVSKYHTYNIVKAEWITRTLSMKERLNDFPELRPLDFHHMTDEMKKSFASKFDEFGDSYTEPIKSEEEFMMLLKNVEKSGKRLSDDDFNELAAEFFNDKFKNTMFFRGFVADFYDNQGEFDLLFESSKLVFKYHSGTCSSENSKYIFVDKDAPPKNRDEFKLQKLVHYRYILDSSDAGKLLNIDNYIV